MAQVPAGGQFQANGIVASSQGSPTVAIDPASNFVVVWNSDDGNSYGVFARRFDASGAPQGGEFRVNTFVDSTQYQAAAAFDAAGRFVVVWTSDGQDGDAKGIFGRRLDAAGSPLGGEFRVNLATTGWQEWPSVASDPAGNFVVVWRSSVGDGSDWGVFARRFDANGSAVGDEFQVNTFTTGYQINNRQGLSMDAGGNFVVVWRSADGVGGPGLFGQRFDASGARRGSEFRINSPGASGHSPAVGVDADGDFVVAWESGGQDGSGLGVFARRYDDGGSPQGAEFRVNTYTTDYQWLASVDSDAFGNFLVVWSSRTQDGNLGGIFAQRFDASGAPRGSEFRVNSATLGDQSYPAAAMDPVGNMTVVWRGPDASSTGVFGQRFGGLTPAALAVDSAGNRVLEPGETVVVAPSWRNLNGAPQTFGGTLGGITGPAGLTYSIVDATALYGTVPSAAVGPCTDCYGVAVSDPAVRPQTHVDASAVEAIDPDAQGQMKAWTLHVGRSFSDVPTTNPFYRFVETLLHHGVTGGCSSTSYCPAAGTSREQMAVFVLVAKEGAGYVPPACTAPVFGDVPPSSPACPWIEELARRGVVGGCGGGNYCPGAMVTREQMAVFVLRTLDPALAPPACATPMFDDVPPSSPFCRWIEELARRAVVSGCGGGNYCPLGPVTREQMGVFISVTFSLALYGP
jgi:hypothetical protein